MIRVIPSNEVFTILLLIGLVVIAVARLVDPKRFRDFTYLAVNSKYVNLYIKEQKLFDWFDGLLLGNLILSLTVFCAIVYRQVHHVTTVSTVFLLEIGGGILSFVVIKVLLERFLARIFSIEDLIDQYVFQKLSYKSFLGVILLPINALLLFTLSPTKLVVFSCIGVLVLWNVIGLITSFKRHQNTIKNGWFYFILYLCALEIAPYLFLCKVLVSK